MGDKKKKPAVQEPHRTAATQGRFLEEAIGREMKRYREKLGCIRAESINLIRLSGPFNGFVEKAVRASTTCLIMAITIATASMRGRQALD